MARPLDSCQRTLIGASGGTGCGVQQCSMLNWSKTDRRTAYAMGHRAVKAEKADRPAIFASAVAVGADMDRGLPAKGLALRVRWVSDE